MDYNYIRLENMIKQLMNKSYVPSSSHAQSAEEIIKGSFKLFCDSVNNYYTFKYGTYDPLYIDPIKRGLFNVQFINDVDITKLIGGVEEGYGIRIDNIGKGVYKVNVINDMFALKSELTEVDNKFDNYTTTENLENVYATKSRVEEIDSKFSNYTTTIDLEENYLDKSYITSFQEMLEPYSQLTYVDYTFATKEELSNVNSKFDDYTTTTDLENSYMKKDDVILPSESQFDVVEGFPYFTVKNGDLTSYSPLGLGSDVNALKIKTPDDVLSKLANTTQKIDVYKINIRNQILLDIDGNILNDFINSYHDGKFKNRIIIKSKYISSKTTNIKM